MECIYLSYWSLCHLHFTFICEGYQYIIWYSYAACSSCLCIYTRCLLCSCLWNNFIPTTILTAIVRLYRESVYNVIDLVSFLAFIQTCFSAAGIALVLPSQRFIFTDIMFGIGIIIPLIYITLLAVYKVLPNTCIVHIKKLALCIFCVSNNRGYKGRVGRDNLPR